MCFGGDVTAHGTAPRLFHARGRVVCAERLAKPAIYEGFCRRRGHHATLFEYGHERLQESPVLAECERVAVLQLGFESLRE
jgi:hypothetical protein